MEVHDIVGLYNDAYAAKYEQEFLLDPLVRSDTESELRLLEQFLQPGVSWLDVACGTGFFLRHFPNTERAGIDLSPAMLRLARSGNPGIPLLEHDFREPLPEWQNRWGLVSCMWYAYGFAENIRELEKLVANLWSWTSMTGTCFLPLADPRLITGVNLPYQAPTHNAGRVMITGILWSYIEDDIGAAHAHLLAPNLEFMLELFAKYFERVEIIRYPPAFEGWEGRPALLASGKKQVDPQRETDVQVGENAIAETILQSRITILKRLLDETAARERDLFESNANSESLLQARITAIKQTLDLAAGRETDLCELLASAQERGHAENAVMAAQVKELDKQLSAARAAIENRDRRIDTLVRSLSWRLTAPMRFAGRPLAGLGRLLRPDRRLKP